MRRRVTLPYHLDFVFRQDADFSFIYTMKNADNTALDNTGYAFEMEVRAAPGATVVDRYTTTSGEIILGGASGRVTVTVPMGTIAGYLPGTYQYDIRETNPLMKSRYIFDGAVNVQTMITRA